MSGAGAGARAVRLESGAGLEQHAVRRWGGRLQLRELYRHALHFYKDKEGKALHLSYEDKMSLVAYTQQAAHGPFDEKTAPPLGVLDVIGRDRRAAWLALGDMTRVQAMAGFIHVLDRLCPLFKTHMEAVQKDIEDKEMQEKIKEDDEKSQIELQERLQLEKQKQQDNKITNDDQVRRIKEALNAQTYQQFLQYAGQQYPGNFDQQAVLIRQLQDQHYHQYMQQLAVDRKLATCNTSEDAEKDDNLNELTTESKSMQTLEKPVLPDIVKDDLEEPEELGEDGFPPVEEANMWTRGDLAPFKTSVRASGGVLNVGHGETLTVRVPTHKTGRCLFWEFATDSYDLEIVAGSDVESGAKERSASEGLSAVKPPVSVVVPIYRRDCHLEVYVGSHTYPGEGVYLLKFDNTYSLWRSKTLYYKVYYTH